MCHVPFDAFGLTWEGLDHLLPDGRGAGGREGEESEELKTACFMSLVSYLASMPEVLRVSPLHQSKILNAVASSVVQAGTIDTTQKPLTAAGLDGTGEVIQVKGPEKKTAGRGKEFRGAFNGGRPLRSGPVLCLTSVPAFVLVRCPELRPLGMGRSTVRVWLDLPDEMQQERAGGIAQFIIVKTARADGNRVLSWLLY